MPLIDPNGAYSIHELRELFGLGADSLPREIRKGRLRSLKRCNKVFVLGPWVLEWLQAAERQVGQREPGEGRIAE